MSQRPLKFRLVQLGLPLLVCNAACSSESPGQQQGSTPATGGSSVATFGPLGSVNVMLPAGEMTSEVLTPATKPNPTAGSVTQSCKSASSEGALQPVALAFVFDVSGSMGKGDKPYHDRTLKWDPVVAATKSFFENASSSGIDASLTFFPSDGDKSERCSSKTYTSPAVDFTRLPSKVFTQAIDTVTPKDANDWGAGTPTLAAITGTLSAIESRRAKSPDVRHALVLVTDGEPAGCSDKDDDIKNVAKAIGAAAANIPTYVIGVKNPVTDEEPNPPDSVGNLQQLAVAGKTESAFIVDTGNPELTAKALADVISKIRGKESSCDVRIPAAPTGQTFDRSRVNVTLATGSLNYSADCKDAKGWHYDNADAPVLIQLCADSCAAVQAAPESKLSVEFGCETRNAGIF